MTQGDRALMWLVNWRAGCERFFKLAYPDQEKSPTRNTLRKEQSSARDNLLRARHENPARRGHEKC
jgi:hypothetical protein